MPGDPVHESDAVPDAPSVIVVGDRLQLSPLPGEADVETLTPPAKSPRLARLTVEVPVAPARTFKPAGTTVKLKSWTLTVTIAVCVKPEAEPATVTV